MSVTENRSLDARAAKAAKREKNIMARAAKAGAARVKARQKVDAKLAAKEAQYAKQDAARLAKQQAEVAALRTKDAKAAAKLEATFAEKNEKIAAKRAAYAQKQRSKANTSHRYRTMDDKILYATTDVILLLLLLVVGYPIIYVLSCSFSSGTAVSSGQVLLWPVDFSIQGYKVIFNYRSVWLGFGNSAFYTIVGTIVNIILSVLAAYPLSRPNYQGRKFGTLLFTITMMFSAGIIPKYLLMSDLGLTNTRWALILGGAISAYNMIIIRTYFRNSIPSELIEAARIDGCSELRTLWSIVLPLSKAVISVVTLYYAVGHWNSYFNAMIYLRDRDLQPLQMVLRDILNASKIDLTQIDDPELLAQMTGMADLIKYALIVVSSAPIIAAYPFVQKFFKTGVMIGSVKG